MSSHEDEEPESLVWDYREEVARLRSRLVALNVGERQKDFFRWYTLRLDRFELFAKKQRHWYLGLRIPALIASAAVPALVAASPGIDTAVGLLAPEYVRHDANLPDVVGPPAQREFLDGMFRAFPDLTLHPDRLIAQNDLVAVHLTAHGTHRSEFMGIPASEREATVQAVDIYRLADRRIAEQWVIIDVLGLMQQLGAIPSPA
jgi:steroid delta-isomerase-like uncharacterized protein